LQLQRSGALVASGGFTLIVALAAAYSLWAIYGAGWEALLWGLALLLAGIPVFWLLRLSKHGAHA
jgi:APA family basic amino acid/polyamine antiporter